MVTENESLPENVLESLRLGETIEAVRRLSDATGLGLDASMNIIEGHLHDRASLASHTLPIKLSNDVIAALQRGQKLVAIKLLREQHHLGLKEAKDIVDNYPADQSLVFGGASSRRLSTAVIALLQRGDKIAAIKLFKEQSGLGLKEAKDAIENHLRRTTRPAGQRPTVDTPHSNNAIWWMAVLLVGYAIYHFLGKSN